VLAALSGNDLILCQITSQASSDPYSVTLDNSDFISGGLSRASRIRPNRLFTADEGIVLYRAGHVRDKKLNDVVDQLIFILRRS
jgi:mRNA interferase MazF